MVEDYGRLWKDVASTTDEGKAIRTLAEILADKEGRAFVSNLGHKDAELCIEILNRGIVEHNPRTAEKRVFLITLRRLVGIHGRLPDSMVIKERIEVSDQIHPSGGFGDIRTGRHMGRLVAVKTLKVPAQEDLLKIRKWFCKEVVLWSSLSHPNVMKISGIQGDMGKGQFVIVSEWMAHGSIMDYIKKNHVNRLELLHGAAQGLKYLHDAGITHGNLKGANILISNDTPPRACLADFGFVTITPDPGQSTSCSAQLGDGAMSFMSPERLVPSRFDMEESIPTQEADIYAFGLVIFQVLTGEIPFRGVRMGELSPNVIQGVRPSRPENASAIGFSDSLWRFVQRCWDGDAKLRPKASRVVKYLDRAAADWNGLMPPCIQAENVAPNSEVGMSDSIRHWETFHQSSGAAPESPTVSQSTHGLFTRPGTPSTHCTESVGGENVTASGEERDSAGYHGISQSPRELVPLDIPTRPSLFRALVERIRHRYRLSKEGMIARYPRRSMKAVASILSEKKFRNCVLNLLDEDVTQLVDYLDSVLQSLDPASPALLKYQCRLRWVCGARGVLPGSCTISSTTPLNTSDQPFASGALTDMYEGTLNGSNVCIGKVRIYSNGDPWKVRRTFCKEAVMWKHLRHRNIVPFIGATLDPLQLVSACMPARGLTEYVTANPESDRLGLLYDVAQGLAYLHSHDVIHGDLKGSNILIDITGRACVAGLDLIVAASDPESTAYLTEDPAARLAAPEILNGDRTISKAADIFSFSMVVIEAFTGAAPFTNSTPTTVAVGILSGRRPERPAHSGLTDELWDLTERCWDQEPPLRPGILEVVSHLGTALVVQEGHADGTDVSTTDDTSSRNTRQEGPSHHLRPEPSYSVVMRWLLAFCKLREPPDRCQAVVEKFPGIESNGSGDSLRRMKCEEWEGPPTAGNTLSGSPGFLRRVAVWFSSWRARSTRNRDGHDKFHITAGKKPG